MKSIPISNPQIGRGEIRAVTKVLKSKNLSQGPVVSDFEKNFSKYVEDRYCIAVNSGTSALHLSLLAFDIKKGDEVIIPSFTFAATANVVALVGATPVFVDIDPESFNIDTSIIEPLITKKTRAIIVVHLFGLPAVMTKIKTLADKYKLIVIEDSAQAHLASINNKYVGTFGDAAAFSFYPTKNMTSGEGGMIVVADKQAERICRLLRNQGMETKYMNEIPGYNLRMTDIQAAIGICQLKKLEQFNEARVKNADFLSTNIKSSQVKLPFVPTGFKHVFHQYTVRIKQNRDVVSKFLSESGIGNGVYYPIPVHKLKTFNLNLNLPESELASKEVLSLPVRPGLSRKQLKKIVSVFNKAIERF